MRSKTILGQLIALSFLTATLSSCGGGSDGPSPVAPKAINNAPQVKVNRDTYLSGTKFCKEYYTITISEFGRYVTVPVDYADPSKGQLKIYVYTMKPFVESKPSYIYVDGGPGQNTHGIMPDYFGSDYNELRFDQRGLGCSAPETFDQYKDASLYSSANNIRDMEEIRKAFGITQWSIYGVSYGTVPATMYGSKYASVTKSVVLEGVFGRPDQVHLISYKAEKINLALAALSSKQRISFSKLIQAQPDDAKMLVQIFYSLFYSDTGMRKMVNILKTIIADDGTINQSVLSSMKKSMNTQGTKAKYQQQPGAVDSNILTIIYCKDLSYRNKELKGLEYSSQTNEFYTDTTSDESYDKECNDVGVTKADEQPYKLEDYPVTIPIYYFQGSHDGATMAIGALNHWRTIAKGDSYFMLAQKGGHNPNLTRLESQDSYFVPSEEKQIFKKAISAEVITQDDITAINTNLPDQKWLLFRDPSVSTTPIVMDELNGINLHQTNYKSLLTGLQN